MTTPNADVIDEMGTNVTASILLNLHHPAVESDDETYCLVCRFAAGWVQKTEHTRTVKGHATGATSISVRQWIAAEAGVSASLADELERWLAQPKHSERLTGGEAIAIGKTIAALRRATRETT